MSRRPGALFVAVSAGRAPLTGTARDACDATRVLWMHRGGSSAIRQRDGTRGSP